MNRAYLTTTVAIGGVLALAAGCSKPDVLQVHFQEGFERTYEIRQTVNNEMSMPIINEGMRQTQDSNVTLRIAVEGAAAEGPASVGVTIEKARTGFKMSFMGETLSFEDDDPNNPIATATQALVGEEYQVTVAPDGDIVRVDGYDALLDKVLASLGTGAISREEVAAYMTEMWNTDQERLSMQKSVFPRLPLTAVERGTTWTVNYMITNPFPMAIEDTYKVLNVHDDRITLDVASTLSPHPTESTIDFGGQFSMSIQVNGDGEGFMEIDRATGWINEASTTLRIRAEAEIQGMPMALPGGMGKIPMTARIEYHSEAI